jgi:hypothetical protein
VNDRSSKDRIFVLLAPALAYVPPAFGRRDVQDEEHADQLAKVQQMRGRIYLEDGAIEPWQLTEDGRYRLHEDENRWHLLTVKDQQLRGCASLKVYIPPTIFSDLGVSQSPQARCSQWGSALRKSVSLDLLLAESELLRYVEAGGWALAPELRCTTEALHIALASYALGELLGGCLGLSTATVRHHSASILRRLGGSTLVCDGRPLPPYYDPAYRCEMEIVRFDSRMPSPKYLALVNQLKAELAVAPVLCAASGATKEGGTPEELQTRQLLALTNAVGREPDRLSAPSAALWMFPMQ